MMRVGAGGASEGMHFVGRTELFDEIRGDATEPAPLYAVTGSPGVGKTTLVSHLADRLTARDHHVVRIGLQSYQPGGLGSDGESNSVAILQRSFDQFCDLIITMHRQLRAGHDRRFRERVRAAKRNPTSVVRRASTRTTVIVKDSENVTIEGSLNVGQDDLNAAITDLVHEFTTSIAELVEDAAERAGEQSRRLYILLDEFDTVMNDVLSVWVATLVRYLRDAVVVLAGRTHMPILAGATHRTLSNFTRAECETFLQNRCGHDVAVATGDRIYSFTGGSPQAMEIVADLVLRAGPEQTMVLLQSWISEGSQSTFSDRLGELVDALLTSGPDPIPHDISNTLVVVRRFDQRLLAVVAAPDGCAADPDDLYARVARLPFVEPSTDAANEFDGHRVHEFVRSVLLRDLKTYHPSQFARLHARALSHYRQEVEEVKAQLGRLDPFLEAVRYKDVRWRRLYTEWLYHLGHVTGLEDRAFARLLFASVYFEAFWWWGYYSPLTFCDDLLHEWSVVCQDELDYQLYNHLSRMANAFPHGWGTRNSDDPAWLEITNALLWVRRLGHLDSMDPATADPSLRTLRAVTSLYLAEAAQSSGQGLTVADRWYADAQATFDTDMGRDWTKYQRGEMWYEAGDADRAIDLVTGIENRSRPRGDHELLGRLAIFTATHELTQRNLAAGANLAVLAVLHSFVFHIRQTAAPDEYSTEFQAEMMQRCTELFTGVAEQATAAEWSRIVHSIHDLLAPLHRFAGDSAKLADGGYAAAGSAGSADRAATVATLVALLPPLPTLDDRHDPMSRCVRLIRWVEANMRDRLERTVSPSACLTDG